jgi:hypothetical protein
VPDFPESALCSPLDAHPAAVRLQAVTAAAATRDFDLDLDLDLTGHASRRR